MNDVLQIILNDIAVLCAGIFLMCPIALYRVNQVYKYRMWLIDQVYLQTRADLEHRREWLWRYDTYEAVGFDKMVLKFWHPLPDFYPDKRFIQEA